MKYIFSGIYSYRLSCLFLQPGSLKNPPNSYLQTFQITIYDELSVAQTEIFIPVICIAVAYVKVT